jgi:selenophosphate synthetase-related protein
MINVYKRRDLTVVEIGDGKSLVIACDSCGGVGEKSGDALVAPNEIVGELSARVPLMEVISSGARVISVTNAVSCEMDPTGEEIIRGVKKEMKKAGVSDATLNGSTEENFPTVATAVGVTVIGVSETDKLKFNKCSAGDRVILIGEPIFGAEILKNENAPTSYDDVYKLLKREEIKEIVPVGSKGALFEAENLAAINGLLFSVFDCGVDLKKSAGPATCVIAAVSKDCAASVESSGAIVIGEFI